MGIVRQHNRKAQKNIAAPTEGVWVEHQIIYIYIWIQVGFFHIGEKFSKWTKNPQTIKMLKLLAMKNAV